MSRPRAAHLSLDMHSIFASSFRRGAQALATATLAVATSLAVAHRASAQGGTDTTAAHRPAPVARARVVTKPPDINGRLDDEAWQSAEPFRDFIQRELQEGAPVTERTEVRIVTDG